MSSSQSFTQQQETKQDKKGSRGPDKRNDLIPSKEKVFVSTPEELEDQLDLPENDDNVLDDPTDLVDDDIDYEASDEDEISAAELACEFEQYVSILPGQTPDFVDSPEISPKQVYSILILPDSAGKFYCRFDPPQGMTSRHVPANDKRYVSLLQDFLLALAQWLEENKQDFLAEPTPENFTRDEECNPDNCIVMQKGFIERINKIMPEDTEMLESYFSKLYNKIWFFWPEWNMPLSALFTEPSSLDFKRAWVIAGCLEAYKHNQALLKERIYDSFETDDYDEYKDQFSGLNAERRLYTLCRTVGLASKHNMDSIHREIQTLCGLHNVET